MKTILLHIENDQLLNRRIETALALARGCGAHLSCLHVTPLEAFVAFDTFGGVFVMGDVMSAIDEEEKALRERVEAELANEDVTWDYRQVTGHTASEIISYAALADLAVMGREPHDRDIKPAISLVGDVLCRSRTPLFVPGDNEEPPNLAGVALVAWDGSYEAANTVRASIELLKLASDVRVIRIQEEKEEGFPNTLLLEYLSRYDVHARLSIDTPLGDYGDKNLHANSLKAHAQAIDASYIVMGGYNHSRLSEYVFGGVTRSMLLDCPIPLIIGH